MAEGIPSSAKLDIMKKMAYGKFANESWPYQLWEPSDQQRILDILASYSTGPRHAPGFRFSINIDPVQFEVQTLLLDATSYIHKHESSLSYIVRSFV
jgi:EAL domain-containing protein (putative c-di-GMP-specific phosphodiesterase class I)